MRPTRRAVVKAAIATVAAPAIVPASVFGDDAPSKRIHVGVIGCGRQSYHANIPGFLWQDQTKVVALCDVDRWRLNKGKEKVDAFYKNTECAVTGDWREIIARDDIDAVMVATTDPWHVPISLAAVRAGKHVSCEKPLTLSIAEGRILADAAKKAGVTFRTDTECRSNAYMHKAAMLVRNGRIGALKHVEVRVPRETVPGGNPTPMPVPEDLDYEMWLGPAPKKPYTLDRVHPRGNFGRPGWMRCRDTCESMITNWGTHLIDVVQLAHDSEHTGPVEVEGEGVYPSSGLWDVLQHFRVHYRYADGVTVDYWSADADDAGEASVKFIGDDGWVMARWFGETKGLTGSSIELLKTKEKDLPLQLPQRSDKGDFIYGMATGEPTMADAEIGHRTCSMCQIGHIAIQVGGKLRWDPATETFPGRPDANKLLDYERRAPWTITA